MVALCSEDSFYVLRYDADYDGEPDEVIFLDCYVTMRHKDKNTILFQDGYESAFDDIAEINETVKTGVWVGDCFIFTNALNRLNYFVGGEIVTVAHLERPLYLLGYLPEGNSIDFQSILVFS